MREHEVPTHVQAEDKVLLWFTFPQVVAMTAVCALAYGAYRYAPVGPSEVRMALAVLLGLAGVAMTVGQIGGRRLPLVAADLLKYRLGARLYAGAPAELVRSEPPAPVQPVRSGPGPAAADGEAGGKDSAQPSPEAQGPGAAGRTDALPPPPLVRQAQEDGERTRTTSTATKPGLGKDRRRKTPKTWLAVMAAALAVAVITVPQAALADGPEDGEGWSSDEIEFQPPQAVEGRRLFVEALSVSGDRAGVHPSGGHGPGPPGPGLRRLPGPGAALLGRRRPGRGGEHPLLPPPSRPPTVPDLLLGGHAGTGWGRHSEGRPAPVPASGN